MTSCYTTTEDTAQTDKSRRSETASWLLPIAFDEMIDGTSFSQLAICCLPVSGRTGSSSEDSIFKSSNRGDGKKGVAMDLADRCRTQADECHRLMLLSQSGAEATVLTSLMRSWKMIANQTDRYLAIMKKDAAQKR
jgi:hypothetical protein